MVTEISRQICQKVEFWHSKWPSWIPSTQLFWYRWALWGYILIPNLACLPSPITKISHHNYSVYDAGRTDDDDGRQVNAIARWSFGPSGLKMAVFFTGIHLEEGNCSYPPHVTPLWYIWAKALPWQSISENYAERLIVELDATIMESQWKRTIFQFRRRRLISSN